jgi:hypothetical protein
VGRCPSILLTRTLPFRPQEALSLPQHVRDITIENKLMRDFRSVTNNLRRVLKEDAILDNARKRLKRVLPPGVRHPPTGLQTSPPRCGILRDMLSSCTSSH